MVILLFLAPLILPLPFGWIGYLIAGASGALYGALAGLAVGGLILGLTVFFFLRLKRK